MTGTVLRIIPAPRLIHSVSLPMSVNNASRAAHCAAEAGAPLPLNRRVNYKKREGLCKLDVMAS